MRLVVGIPRSRRTFKGEYSVQRSTWAVPGTLFRVRKLSREYAWVRPRAARTRTTNSSLEASRRVLQDGWVASSARYPARVRLHLLFSILTTSNTAGPENTLGLYEAHSLSPEYGVDPRNIVPVGYDSPKTLDRTAEIAGVRSVQARVLRAHKPWLGSAPSF